MSTSVGAKTKGWVMNNKTSAKLSFQYNPDNFSYSRSVSYGDISSPGMAYPITQYLKGNIRTFPLTLFLYDKPFTGVVNKYMTFFGAFLTPETNVANYTKPPEMTFCYGPFIRRCVMESLEINNEEYDESGNITIATFSMQLRQVGV